jgi:hypothetical protein
MQFDLKVFKEKILQAVNDQLKNVWTNKCHRDGRGQGN